MALKIKMDALSQLEHMLSKELNVSRSIVWIVGKLRKSAETHKMYNK